MTEHWNVQISIQRVETVDVKPSGMLQNPEPKRSVLKVLDLAVTADTEDEAYAKAHRMLSANETVYSPIPEGVPSPLAVPLPRQPDAVRPRPIRDNPQA